jgi:hypothetical protein
LQKKKSREEKIYQTAGSRIHKDLEEFSTLVILISNLFSGLRLAGIGASQEVGWVKWRMGLVVFSVRDWKRGTSGFFALRYEGVVREGIFRVEGSRRDVTNFMLHEEHDLLYFTDLEFGSCPKKKMNLL